MSQEREIDDKDLKKVTGGGPVPKDFAQAPGEGGSRTGRGTPPLDGGNPNMPDDFDTDTSNIPGQGPIDFGQ